MSGRTHIVLVPGFGGFDAFGSVHYYAGTTDAFRKHVGTRAAAIHYFDNLPTAGVDTRARALKEYLVTRVGRGEMQEGDTIVLIGHSTGGLDIRKLIKLLHSEKDAPNPVDDGGESVSNKLLLALIKRVVFLSVPHRGTNIADWVQAHRKSVDGAIDILRQQVKLAPLEARIESIPPIEWLRRSIDTLRRQRVFGRLEGLVMKAVTRLVGPEPDLIAAAMDVGREISKTGGEGWLAAQSRQIRSDVILWLDNIHDDFMAIPDLMSVPAEIPDLVGWDGIEVVSCATIGNRPYGKLRTDSKVRSTPCVLLKAWREKKGARFDITYRATYAACSAGPFVDGSPWKAKWLEGSKRPSWASAETYSPESWENDGIVNTASMFFPKGETAFVLGDHGDIIGHYHQSRKRHAELREYESYDFLGSRTDEAAFDDGDFDRVWRGVFAFALTGVWPR